MCKLIFYAKFMPMVLCEADLYALKSNSQDNIMQSFDLVTSFGFIGNVVDECIYLKICETKFIFLDLYDDYILLTSSEMSSLRKTKHFLLENH